MVRWQQRYTDHLTLALVRSGDLDANRELIDPIGLSHVRLYRETENEYPQAIPAGVNLEPPGSGDCA